MKDGRKTRVEDLLFPQLMQMVGEAFRYDEAATTPTLSPLMRALGNKITNPIFRFGIMARTATLFLVDYDEFFAAISSTDEAPRLPQLPPLPYPRIAVECAQEMVWTLGSEQEGAVAELEMFAINEARQGEEWNVALVVAGADAYVEELEGDGSIVAQRQLLVYTLKSDGSIWQLSGNPEQTAPFMNNPVRTLEGSLRDWVDEIEERFIPERLWEVRYEPDEPRARALRHIPVEFAHLANARGVNIEPVAIPRSQRRRFERNKLVHPQVYFVKIGGEDSESFPGHGDRQYHCRWLVRGHWVRPKHRAKHWRRAHIRGPAGAPWRGRPVYVIEPEEVPQAQAS